MGASSCRAAMAAWTWYGPGRPAASAAWVRARPSAIRSWSQRARSWASSRTSDPSASVRASRRASWSSISASNPVASGSSGSSETDEARQPDRLGTQLAADERVARGGGIALVEDQVQDAQDAVEALRQELGRRDPVRDPGVADLLLRADQALRQRGLGHEERAGDLRASSGRPGSAASAPRGRPSRAPDDST